MACLWQGFGCLFVEAVDFMLRAESFTNTASRVGGDDGNFVEPDPIGAGIERLIAFTSKGGKTTPSS